MQLTPQPSKNTGDSSTLQAKKEKKSRNCATVLEKAQSMPGDMDYNSTNNISPEVELFQLIMYTPTFSLGLLFNVMALSFLFFKAKKLSEATVYMIALIFLDTLLLFTLPFKIISYHHPNKWKLGSVFCSILESLYFVNMYGSILISLCICIDRYIAIRHPFIAPTLRSTKKAAVVCAVICLGVSAGTVSTFQLHEKGHNISSCFHNFSKSTWENTALFSALQTTFFGSMTAMAFCTVQIVRCLRKRRKPDNPHTYATRAEKIVVANCITFLVCFTPYHVTFFLYFLVKNGIMHMAYQPKLRDILQITLCWANLNCCLDGVCYYFVLKESLESPLQKSERTARKNLDPHATFGDAFMKTGS
ncbi:G-protein coupled receptor 55 [Anas platyrhynchos]|uniref:G-protein coupled receptors family 1 profile domain-containing protein n=1 Tax=Anas platyrhynchos TaxID=8839 RepID=A0A8B9ZI63_ANAPL|nr:LOW QUALITY PROTEIN: G-protein coupled receptor 55 [Anas platyrhynchos]